MSEKKRRTCQICGRPYVPTSNVQKYCPDCRKEMQLSGGNISEAYKAYKKAGAPGPVRITKIENPEAHLMDFTETPEDPDLETLEEYIAAGSDAGSAESEGTILIDLERVETPKQELPADLAFVEEAAEILRRYYRGELIDKDEFLARIRERLEDF